MKQARTHAGAEPGPGAAALLERDGEIDDLRAAIAEVAELGTGRLVLIEGPPGIGKTRLLHEARRLAADAGLAELAARGNEVEREFAFGIVHQLLDRALPADLDARREMLGGSAAAVEQVLAPGAAPEAEADLSYAVLHGLYSLVADLCERSPRLLTIDDAHWADGASLRFLTFLARRLDGLSLVLLLTARAVRPGASDDPLAELHHEPRASVVMPRPLSESAVAELATTRLGAIPEGALARAFHEATGGNPFLLWELLTELGGEDVVATALTPETVRDFGPRRVASAVLLRLGGLGGAAPRLARAAAVLDDGAELRSAAELAGIDPQEATHAADALVAADILTAGVPLRFAHPLVRTSIYDDTPPAAREDAHRRAAWILAEAGHPTERVAAHLLRIQGTGDERAVETLRDAARRAIAQAAPGSAIRYLERALAEPPAGSAHGEVLAELGAAEMLVDGAASQRHLREAVRSIDEPLRRAEASHALAWALFFAGRNRQSADASRQAAEEVGDTSPRLSRLLEAATLTAAVHDPALTALGREMTARVRERASTEDVGDRALLALAAWDDARRGDPRALTEAEEALRGGALLERDNGGTPMLAGYTLAVADQDAGLEAFERGLALAHEQGSMFAFACHKLFAGRTRHLRGDLVEALADLTEGLAATPIEIGAIWGESWLADALLDRGEMNGAAAALARLDPGTDTPNDAHWLWYLDSRSKLLLARGEVREGVAATLECGRLFEALDGRNPALVPWRSRAALGLAALGDADRARSLAGEEVKLARRWGGPRAFGVALRTAGLVADADRQAELLAEAVSVLRSSRARLALAEALCDLGAALRRSGQRSASQEPLREALDLATRCGARPLEERAREELVAVGARPRRAALHGPASLTAAELRVATRAAQGMTNREIAAALFVTRTTIEYHLRNAYRKLEIQSRDELATSLGGEHAGPTAAVRSPTPESTPPAR